MKHISTILVLLSVTLMIFIITTHKEPVKTQVCCSASRGQYFEKEVINPCTGQPY